MKKYAVIIGSVLFVVIVLSIVFKITGNNVSTAGKEPQTDIVSGTAIFSEGPLEKVRTMEYVDFEGNKISITDDKKISDLRNALMNCSYTRLEEDDYLEGFYTFCLITDNDRISVGLSNDVVAYNGSQYKVKGSEKLIPDSLAEIIK